MGFLKGVLICLALFGFGAILVMSPRLFMSPPVVAAALLDDRGSEEQPSKAVPTILRLGIFVPDRVVHVRHAMVPWLMRVNEKIGPMGYEIQLFSGGALGHDGEMQLRLLMAGVTDITWFPFGYVAGRFPEISLLEIPLLSDDPMALTRAFWRLHERGFFPGLDDVTVLGLSVSPANYLHMADDFDGLSGLSNRKIRVANAAQARIVEAMGATAVGGITATQVAESLSRKMIDGVLFSWHGTKATGIELTTRSHMTQALGFTPSAVVMNKDRFRDLPPKVKEAILSESGEAFSLALTASMMAEADKAIARVKESPDHQFYRPSPSESAHLMAAFTAMAEQWQGTDQDRRDLLRALSRILEDMAAEKAPL
ncbi:hypothetical protein JCM17846_24370 [Iodidimonas nitroreducens]|uniref:C4-dicarboxylate ABC transporter substrate-binding protein n=2 Tax=Iodidimonas nitroreducens TaxID=1236968 RepID=A0A5A7NAS6_9PROT|nr:TRAP-type mannitol/chloroaromatic compound transport system, periplasmic component [alpha proteobacterium Q-1]GER04755.1 hypothetical protein JCM17846_24370 [Iodidimonas nitroreducens]